MKILLTVLRYCRTVRLVSRPTDLQSQYLRIDVSNSRTKQDLVAKQIEVKFADRTATSVRHRSGSEQRERPASGSTVHADTANKGDEQRRHTRGGALAEAAATTP